MDSTLKTGKFVALSYKDFRLLLIAQFLSVFSTQMQLVAINWQMYLMTHSAIFLGLIGLVRFVPILFFSLIGGTVADTHNRKLIIITAQTILVATSLLFAFTTNSHTITPFIIYLGTALSAVAFSFDLPARQALVPNVTKREHFANAMSLTAIATQTATIAGPALAGFFIAKFGISSVYSITAVSFCLTTIAPFFIKTSGKVIGNTSEVSIKAVVEGLIFVKKTTMIWATMLLDFFSTFFSSATALMPIFAKDILHVGPQELGLLYAAPAIGAVTAGGFMAHRGKLHNEGKILLLSVALYGLATVLFGLSQIFLLSFLALILIGASDSISMIIRNTVRQLLTPDYIRGRMTSVNMIFFVGGPQLGEFEAGLLAAAVGAPLSVVIGGVATVIVVAGMAVLLPTLRKYNT